MKKLISILAAATIVVASPLTVVACKKPDPEVTDKEFDFVVVKNNFMNLVKSVFSSGLKTDLDKYAFFSEKDSPFNMTKQQLIDNQDKLKDPNSKEFAEVSKNILDVINWNKIVESLKTQLNNDVNFRQLLINGQSPLKNGLSIKSIKIAIDTNAITISVDFSALVSFLDEKQVEDSEPIGYSAQLVYFEEEDVAGNVNLISDEYTKNINKAENANSINFEKNSGNFEINATELDKDDAFKTQLTTLMQKVVMPEGISNEYGFNYKEMDVKTSTTNVIDASVANINSFLYKIKNTFPKYKVASEILEAGLLGDAEKEQQFIDGVASGNEDFVTHREAVKIKNIASLIAKHEGMNIAINPYNLEYNYNANNIFKIGLENFNFALDFSKDEKLISLYKSDVSKVFVTYKEEQYELPTTPIIVRQNTGYKNTQELYNNFISDAYNFQKKFFNLDKDIEQNSKDFIFYLNKPTTWNEEYVGKDLEVTDVLPDLINANAEALAINNKLNLSHIWQSQSGWESFPTKYLHFNNEGHIYFINDNFIPKYNGFRTYFFSSGLTKGAEKTDFILSDRVDFSINDIKKDPSAWRFK